MEVLKLVKRVRAVSVPSDSRGEAEEELGECWLAGSCGDNASLVSSKLYTSEVSGVLE